MKSLGQVVYMSQVHMQSSSSEVRKRVRTQKWHRSYRTQPHVLLSQLRGYVAVYLHKILVAINKANCVRTEFSMHTCWSDPF